MAIVRVGGATNTSGNTSVSVSYASTAGNLLTLMVLHQGGTISAVTDSASNTWTAAPNTDTQATQSSTSQRRVQIWYCLNAAAVTSVSVTQAAASGFVAQVEEYSGVASYRASTSSASTATSPPAATVAASTGDLVIGCLGYNETTAGTRLDTLNSGYTETTGGTVSTTRLSTAYSVQSSSSTTGPSWTMTSGSTGSATAAFASATTYTAGSFLDSQRGTQRRRLQR